MIKKLSPQNLYSGFLQIGVLVALVYLTSFYSYTLFHSLVEMVAVVIGFGVYMVTWNSRHFISNKFFIFLGIAFFFIAFFDLLHAFAYKGYGVFIYNTGSNLATQLWLAARFLQGFSFLAAALFINKNIKLSRVFYVYTLISLALLASIFVWPIFPIAYIEGVGLTRFKELSEIVICLAYIVSIFIIFRRSKAFNPTVFKLIIWALILSTISEIMFMVYVGVYDNFNLAGHLIKIVTFALIYIAVIETGLRKPYSILFKDIKDSEIKFQQSEQKFRTIFNNVTFSILMTDLEGRILEMNNRSIIKFGYSKNELINQPLLSALHASYKDILNTKEFQEIKNGNLNYYEFENCYVKKDGHVLWGDSSVSIVLGYKDSPEYILWLIKDITQNKEIEKSKMEFVSLASHQLRTPLTSVQLASELLIKVMGKEIDTKQGRYITEIHDSTLRMSAMIRDLLNVSRIELGTLSIKSESLDLNYNIKQISAELALQFKIKNLELSQNYSDDILNINFDVQILRMIIENLLTNAINYTPMGGKIGIKTELNNKDILISISDTGCGIPDSEQSQIFQKSFRAQNAKEINTSGTGLGLYIVNSVAEKSGIKIWFDSRENIGTTFYIAIPLKN